VENNNQYQIIINAKYVMVFFVVNVHSIIIIITIKKKTNLNNINGCSCPACGELSGNNFKGSGKDYESFIYLKCGENQSVANYYKCNICNGIFCSQCPYLNDRIFAFCPSCGQPAGKKFKGSGKDYESFICLKCGENQSVANYYKCYICQGLFCYKCPFIHSWVIIIN